MAAPASTDPPGNRRIYMKSVDFNATKARVEYHGLSFVSHLESNLERYLEGYLQQQP